MEINLFFFKRQFAKYLKLLPAHGWSLKLEIF